jgi:carbon monoxide dehydrogenase subunit G
MAIEFSGEYRIRAPIQAVWEALNDPAVLRACIAGCQQLDKVSDTEMSALVVAKVGPVSATFRGSVVLSELDPPNGYTLSGQGQGGAAGFARMAAKVGLTADGAHTVLRYSASADIGGKLASVGSRLVQSVAKKNADDFFAAFARRLGGGMPEPDVSRAAAPAVAAPATVAATAPGAGAVPAWVVPFCTGLGIALGYLLGHLH